MTTAPPGLALSDQRATQRLPAGMMTGADGSQVGELELLTAVADGRDVMHVENAVTGATKQLRDRAASTITSERALTGALPG